MKLSEIYGKELINLNGEACGYVRGVYAADGKIEYLACADGEENEFDVDFKDVKFIGGRLIFNDRRDIKRKSRALRLGAPAYTKDGEYTGYVKEITVENGNIKNYVIGGKRYSPSLLSVGDAAIIRQARTLKDDVVKGGKVILKKGTELDGKALKKAETAGEYVQAQLKSM
ncbi:MAG: PRC-barrel domain-containing protein [Clostridia bacterium]|nr:PRC-barrel domain-containing protein [Clostridia bacterium]